MILYSTDLLIDGFVIPYEVGKEGTRLFFKPLKMDNHVDAPIFWVTNIDGIWEPMNIEDQKFIKQVQDDILMHEID